MKRLPNMYGTVYKLSGSRRKPWIARKLNEKVPDHDKKRMIPQYVTIGYYATRSEALAALAAYNAEPHDVSRKTIRDVYNLWSVEHFKKLKSSRHYENAFNALSGIADLPIGELKLDDIQFIFDTSGKNRPVLIHMKGLLKHLFRYAVIHDIVPQGKLDMIQYLDVGTDNPNKIERSIFTPEDRAVAFAGTDPIDRVTAFMLCTGLRVAEYAALRPEDIYDGVIHVKASKTAAGIRAIPLPKRLEAIPLERMKTDTIRRHMRIKYDHRPHDTRHTFATIAVEAGIDQRIIDALIGHVPDNLTLNTYTHITPEAMRDAMERIAAKC